MIELGFMFNGFVLSLVWYLIARYFYPFYAKKLAFSIADDPEYIKKSQDAQEEWFRDLVRKEVSKIQADVEKVFRESVPEDLQEQIIVSVGDAIQGADFKKMLTGVLNGWYGSMAKAATKENAAQEDEMRDAVQYAQMNQGNPDAMSLISQRLMQKSPALGLAMQMLTQSGSGNGQAVQANQTKSRW